MSPAWTKPPKMTSSHIITKFAQYVGFQLRILFILISLQDSNSHQKKAENTNLTVINLSLSTLIGTWSKIESWNDGWNIDPRTRFNMYDYLYPLVKKRSYIWNILMFNRKYISSKGPFSTAMLVYQSVFWLTYFFWTKKLVNLVTHEVIVELWHWQESQHISSHFYIYTSRLMRNSSTSSIVIILYHRVILHASQNIGVYTPTVGGMWHSNIDT